MRERQKGVTAGVTQGVTKAVTPEIATPFFAPLPKSPAGTRKRLREMPPELSKSNSKFERWK